jgi:hypothetical protein
VSTTADTSFLRSRRKLKRMPAGYYEGLAVADQLLRLPEAERDYALKELEVLGSARGDNSFLENLRHIVNRRLKFPGQGDITVGTGRSTGDPFA